MYIYIYIYIYRLTAGRIRVGRCVFIQHFNAPKYIHSSSGLSRFLNSSCERSLTGPWILTVGMGVAGSQPGNTSATVLANPARV